MNEKPDQKISLLPILLVNFIGSLGFSIVLPFMVFLVARFSGSSLLFGAMVAVYPFFQLIGAPILGKWSDRFGRRKILLLSQAGTALAWVLFLIALFLPVVPIVTVNNQLYGMFFLSAPFILLIIARALDGITGGNISVANAYIADVSTEKTRKKNFGQMAVFSNLGFIVGPALAGILGATVYMELPPILVAFGISLVALILIIRFLPESKPCTPKPIVEKTGIRRIFGFEMKECISEEEDHRFTFKDVWRLAHIPFLLFLTFLIFLGSAGIFAVTYFRLEKRASRENQKVAEDTIERILPAFNSAYEDLKLKKIDIRTRMGERYIRNQLPQDFVWIIEKHGKYEIDDRFWDKTT